VKQSARKANLKPETLREFDTKSTKAIINPLRSALFELMFYSVRDDFRFNYIGKVSVSV
jgi:hypothetical protein